MQPFSWKLLAASAFLAMGVGAGNGCLTTTEVGDKCGENRCPEGMICNPATSLCVEKDVCDNGIVDEALGEVCDNGLTYQCTDFGYHYGIALCNQCSRAADPDSEPFELGRCGYFGWVDEYTPTSDKLFGLWGGANSYAVGENGTILYREKDETVWHREASGTEEWLRDVWGWTDEDKDMIIAVGAQSTILQRGQLNECGENWTQMEIATDIGDVRLHGVWGRGPEDVFAVGDGGTILHYNGGAWNKEDLQPATTEAALHDVWGTSTGEVYVVGDSGTILYRDGNRSWHTLDIDNPDTKDLRGVWGYEGNVFVVGLNGFIRHCHKDCGQPGKAQWDNEPHPTIHYREVWGRDGENVFAVGDAGKVAKFDGTSWSQLESPTTAQILAVWGDSETMVIAGANGHVMSRSESTWRNVYTGVSEDLHGIWGDDDSDLFVVGTSDEESSPIYRYKYADHSSSPINAVPGGVSDLTVYKSWGMGNKLFAVGRFVANDEKRVGILLYEDPDQWRAKILTDMDEENEAERDAFGIWGDGAGNVYVVGVSMNAVTKCSATGCNDAVLDWKDMPPPEEGILLRGISGSGPDNIFAVGDKGTIAHFDGAGWTVLESGGDSWLQAIWTDDRDHAIAAGEGGVILGYDGTTWTSTLNPSMGANLHSITGSRDDLIILGELVYGDVIMHYNGTTWSSVVPPWNMRADLLDVWRAPDGKTYFVGRGGVFQEMNLELPAPESSDTSE